MRPKLRQDSDDLLEILSAYRLPTIIMSVGLILAIIGFQFTLQYDMQKSERAFREISEQVYRGLDTEVQRHTQLIGSMARLLGQIKNLEEEEFSDISRVFTETTFFTDFYFYEFNEGDGVIKLSTESVSADGGSVTEFFSSASPDEKIDHMAGLPEIRTAIERTKELGNIYVSNPYQVMVDGSTKTFVVFAARVSERYRENLFLVGILSLDQLFAHTLNTETDPINVRVYNSTGIEKSIIYENIEPETKEFFSTVEDASKNILAFTQTQFFHDHHWEVHIFSSLRSLINYIGLFPWITFSSLIAVTGLLSFIVFRITTENLKAQILVEQQTKSLREYAEKLEISNRDLDDFAHIASHDLKEPLRGLYNFAEFLSEDYHDKLDQEGQNKLNTLKALARRMEALIENLLEYSKLSRVDLSFKKTDLNQSLHSVLSLLDVWLKEQKATVTIKNTLPEIVCDSVKVEEVFRNLITNAVKYNDKSDKIVEVGSITDYEDWGATPVFYVRDNGIGIAEEHRKHVFKIFKRLHARDEFGGGTGAGLTIIWKIIERHGGKIWIESNPGEGTTFFFTLRRKNDGSE